MVQAPTVNLQFATKPGFRFIQARGGQRHGTAPGQAPVQAGGPVRQTRCQDCQPPPAAERGGGDDQRQSQAVEQKIPLPGSQQQRFLVAAEKTTGVAVERQSVERTMFRLAAHFLQVQALLAAPKAERRESGEQAQVAGRPDLFEDEFFDAFLAGRGKGGVMIGQPLV